MRPRLVEFLARYLGTDLAGPVVPTGPWIYALAILAMVWVLVRRGRSARLDPYHLLGVALWGTVGGMVGARVLYLLQHLPAVRAVPEQVLSIGGGSASWGAYFGGLLGLSVYAGMNRLQVARYADVAASVAGLGIAIGRWACFLNGDDFGVTATVPWAVRFPHASMPFVLQVRSGLLDPTADLSLPVHPVQLYLSLSGVVVFLCLSRVWNRYQARPGTTFCLFWLVYGVARFGLENFRGDQPHLTALDLTPPQVMVLAVIGPALLGLWFSRESGDRPPTQSSSLKHSSRIPIPVSTSY